MRKIIVPLLSLLLATTWFAAWTFAHLERFSAWGLCTAAMLLTAAFFPTSLLGYRIHARWLSALNVIAGISVGYLTFFALAAIGCWTALGVSRALGFSVDASKVATWIYGMALLVGTYALFNAFWLRVTRVSVRLANLPAFWNGRTIALASDIHLGNFRGASFSRRVVSRLMGLGAECILVGGDMFDGVRTDVAGAIEPWSALSANSGVYFVGGNHDDYGGRNAYFEAIRRVGMTVLQNEKVDIRGLQLVGVHDRETHSPAEFAAFLEKAKLDRSRASVLLAHRPENLAVPEQAGISLQLSGHTHGGQFWPWIYVARRVHREFAHGLNRFGGMLVFTSTGAGTWGPPFRLGTRSEVVLIRLESA
jgi:predicted MPP superfamily phosphohydrolase